MPREEVPYRPPTADQIESSMVVLERNEDGTPRRTTVAVWDGPTEEEGRPGRWRLDRISDPIKFKDPGDDSPVFELVDERDPSWLHGGGSSSYAPVWLEFALPERVWRITEEWADISEKRNELGARPFELREKTIGICIALTGQRPRAGYLFENWKDRHTWLFVPLFVDDQMIEGARRVDDYMDGASSEQLAMGPSEGTMEVLLGREVEKKTSSGPTKYVFPPSVTTPNEKMFVSYSRFHPPWTTHLFSREIQRASLSGVLLDGIRQGVFVKGEEAWLTENSSVPKLLLDPEEIEVFRMLGEDLPVLWKDRMFVDWMRTRV